MPRHTQQIIPVDGLMSMLWPLVGLSLMSNLAVLVSPLFMMQVFNKVVLTGNHYTLALLLVVAVIILSGVAFAETLRDRVEAEAGLWREHRVQTTLNTRRDAPLALRQRAGFTAGSGLLRNLAQIGGAFILMQGQITAGAMVAATLIGAKVRATIEGGALAIPDIDCASAGRTLRSMQ